MPIIRNPFSRRVAGDIVADESARPGSAASPDGAAKSPRPHPGTIDVKQPTEYKLSGSFARCLLSVHLR